MDEHVGGGSSEDAERKVVVLREWYIRIGARGTVVLEGNKIGDAHDEIWHSGHVFKRLTSREVSTKSGTVYCLQGEARIDKCYSLTGTLDGSIARKFRNGFPRNWSSLIKSMHSNSEDIEEDVKTCEKEDMTSVKVEPAVVETDQPSVLDTSCFLSSLKRSSRGRILKPAVTTLSPESFNLSSELYKYDMLGSFTGLSAPVVDLTGDNSTLELVGAESNDQRKDMDSERAVTQQEPPHSSEDRREKRSQGVPKGGLKSRVKSTPCASVSREGKKRSRVRIPSLTRKAAIKETVGEWSLDEEEGSSLHWDQESISRLKSIVSDTPAMTARFWEVVAEQLGTGHTARECNTQYTSNTASKPRRRKARKTKEKTEVKEEKKDATVTARAGTLKRKQQIRGALEKMDHGYSDDIFDSTPFKKKFKRVELSESSDDECVQKEAESRPITTPNEVKRRLGAPTSHTPKLSDYATSTDAKTRSSADKLIVRVQKAKKAPKPKAKKAAEATVKTLNSGSLLRNIRTGEITNYHVFENSSDDSSDVNPFSDIEDAYSDIIARLR